jgi:hypothetical protein
MLSKDRLGMPLVVWAAKCRSRDAMAALLNAGAPASTAYNRCSLLHFCCSSAYDDGVLLLLSRRCSLVDAPDSSCPPHSSSLHLALENLQFDTVMLFLKLLKQLYSRDRNTVTRMCNLPDFRGILPLHAALNRQDAPSTAVDLCRELLSIGASPLAAAASTSAVMNGSIAANGASQPGETAIDLATRLRLWDAAALFISSGKAGAVVSSADNDGGDVGSAATATSTAAAKAKVAAAATELIDAASAGRVSVVAELLLMANGAILAHQTTAPGVAPITPIHAILTMSHALRDNISNITSLLSSAILKLSRMLQHCCT